MNQQHLLDRIESLERRLEMLQIYCENLSDQQLRILKLIGRYESENIKETY